MPLSKEDELKELAPNQIVRLHEGWKYFGYKHTTLEAKIQAGEIPAPLPLSATGRAKGWLGRQILEHHRKLIATAEAKQQQREALAAEA